MRRWKNSGGLGETRGVAFARMISRAAVAAALVVTLAVSGGASAAEGDELTGQVVVSDVHLTPGIVPVMLKRFQRTTVNQSSGFWRLHMVGFLDRAAPSDTVTFTAYDVTSPGERKPVKVFQIPVEMGARTVHLNDFVVAPSMGFEPGHRYEMTIESSGAGTGKQDVYAKGVVTLR